MKPRLPLQQSPWLAAVARPVLMFIALADGLLSLELWTLRSPHARSAATAVLQAVAPVRLLVALALAGSALYTSPPARSGPSGASCSSWLSLQRCSR